MLSLLKKAISFLNSITIFLSLLMAFTLLMSFTKTQHKETVQKEMMIVLLGPPGSGKGTQGKILAEKLGIPHVSVGDLLRDMIKNDPVMGKEISAIIDKGQLLSDDIVNKIMKQALLSPKYSKGCILDGYPRNVAQAEFLKSFTKQNLVVIALSLEDNVIIERILNRAICSKCGEINKASDKNACAKCGSSLTSRKDDNEEVARNRIEVYKKETAPVIEYFNKHGKVYEVDANQDVNNISKILLDYVKSI